MESGIAYIQKSKNCWLSYSDPIDVITAREYKEVMPALSLVEANVESGLYAAGFVSYEAAPVFDNALSVNKHAEVPLLWFGVYRKVDEVIRLPVASGIYSLSEWDTDTTEVEYLSCIEEIKNYIQAGDSYQVNYTIRLKSKFTGDPYAFFYNLQKSQGGRNCAFIDTGEIAVCSASPELFFALNGNALKSCPMKGTAKRGMTWQQDMDAAKKLRESRKDRAENVMIVDMIRNDMGRIAESGSVIVESAYDVERYPTVLQMTSTVRSKTSAGITGIFKAMFPCASITGAPKVRTMEIIKELERSPRGIYTGAIGCLAPGRKALFNVAIRTAVINRKYCSAEYGAGGGVVWDSTGEMEYSECLDKALVLKSEPVDFCLLETILWDPLNGYAYLEEHIARISGSAKYFNIPLNELELSEQMTSLSAEMAEKSKRVRLLVELSGNIKLEVADIEETDTQAVRLKTASEPVDRSNVFLYHKTTNRSFYEKALASCSGCDDVILYNERGEITESTISNIVVSMNGRKFTPPVECGLLPGTMREALLRKNEIAEAKVTLDDLRNADEIFLINSVRGWRRAQLVLND